LSAKIRSLALRSFCAPAQPSENTLARAPLASVSASGKVRSLVNSDFVIQNISQVSKLFLLLTGIIFLRIAFVAAMKLVRARAEGMQYASEMVKSGMATVMYGPDTTLGHACKRAVEHCISKNIENPVCMVANYLYPHCKVVAGNEEVKIITSLYYNYLVAPVIVCNENIYCYSAFAFFEHTNLLCKFQVSLNKLKINFRFAFLLSLQKKTLLIKI